MASAPHFTPELFRFLRQLDRHNDKAWFERNRDRYLEHVRDPMLAFIEDFAPRLRRISRHFVADARPQGGSMFRIHRDMRFAKDRRPYKTVASAHFRHERARDVHAPGFYLHLGLDEVFVGTGIWRPDAGALGRIRRAIADDPARWRRAVNDRTFRAHHRLDGDALKRPPRGFDPDHPLIEDLKRKDFVSVAHLDERAACRPDFLDRFTEICRAGRPFMKYLTESLDLAW